MPNAAKLEVTLEAASEAAWRRWGSHPNWHRMINGTKFDVRRHHIVRKAFMEALVENDDVKKVMDGWQRRYCRDLGKQISRALKKEPSIKISDERWEAFRDAALTALPESSKKALDEDGIRLTQTKLQLPWAWVFRDLIDLFAANVLRKWLGHSAIRSIDYTFDPTVILEVSSPSEEQMKALMNPGSRGADDERLSESGRWLCEYMVRGDSIYAIAKRYHEKNHHRKVFKVECDCRDNRKRDLKTAYQLLGICPFRFPVSRGSKSPA